MTLCGKGWNAHSLLTNERKVAIMDEENEKQAARQGWGMPEGMKERDV